MAIIKDIRAWEILDSRGMPTVKVEVELEDGEKGTFAVPSGASTGKYEAVELRDGEDRYMGKGVRKAIQNVNQDIRSFLIGIDSSDQNQIDSLMIDYDGTENKSKLGSNAVLGVSVACAKAQAISSKRELYNYLRSKYNESYYKLEDDLFIPIPMFNIMNGGAHADNNLTIQEFMVVPSGIAEYPEQLRAAVEINWELKKLLKSRGATTAVGDEGGFAPTLPSDEAALDLMLDACTQAKYRDGFDIKIGLDVAISQYWESDDEVYALPNVKEGKALVGKAEEIIDFYMELIEGYPILSIEDGFNEDNWEEWQVFMQTINSRKKDVMVVGDDLTVTNPKRVQKAIDESAMNAMIIKPNQIGTLTEVFEVVDICKKNNIRIIVSHRSGETVDTFTADLAVALGANYIKDGAPIRGERVAKYNRLLEIYASINQG